MIFRLISGFRLRIFRAVQPLVNRWLFRTLLTADKIGMPTLPPGGWGAGGIQSDPVWSRMEPELSNGCPTVAQTLPYGSADLSLQ